MRCPSCAKNVEKEAWICPHCDHILDPSVLGEDLGDPNRVVQAERTKLVAWAPTPDPDDESIPDAMILGDVGVAEDEFNVVHAAGATGDGKTSTFLYYTAGQTSRIIHPDAIPLVTNNDSTIPRTPYEDFILSRIDGVQSVRQIQRASGLAPQEVVVTLLTLLDKGAIRIQAHLEDEVTDSEVRAEPLDRLVTEEPIHAKKDRRKLARARRASSSEAMVGPPSEPGPKARPSQLKTTGKARLRVDPNVAAGPIPDDFDDLPSVSDFDELITSDEEEGTREFRRDRRDRRLLADDEEPRFIPRRGHVDEPATLSESGADISVELPLPGASGKVESSHIDAENLIESEVSVRDEATSSEEVTKAVPVPERPPKKRRGKSRRGSASRRRSSRSETPSPVQTLEDDVVSRAVEQGAPLPEPGDLDLLETPRPDEVVSAPQRTENEEDAEIAALRDAFESSGLIDRVPTPAPPPAPVLDPRFLEEVPPSSVGRRPFSNALLSEPPPLDIDSTPNARADARGTPGRGSAPARPVEDAEDGGNRRQAVANILKRGPIMERDRRRDPAPAVEVSPATPDPTPVPPVVEEVAPPPQEPERAPAPSAPAPAPSAPRPTAATSRSPASTAPVDPMLAQKAQKLFDQALKDKAEGNLVSAKMNMKLAITFDPSNEIYQQAFDELSQNPAAAAKSPGLGRSKARELYDSATQAENAGDIDRAIELLWKAIDESKQPAFYNRLGVILATKKHEFVVAQELIEKAIDAAPGNTTYENNLKKVLSMAAARGDRPKDEPKKGGLLGSLFGRKK